MPEPLRVRHPHMVSPARRIAFPLRTAILVCYLGVVKHWSFSILEVGMAGANMHQKLEKQKPKARTAMGATRQPTFRLVPLDSFMT
jgi:hypothetical protein